MTPEQAFAQIREGEPRSTFTQLNPGTAERRALWKSALDHAFGTGKTVVEDLDLIVSILNSLVPAHPLVHTSKGTPYLSGAKRKGDILILQFGNADVIPRDWEAPVRDLTLHQPGAAIWNDYLVLRFLEGPEDRQDILPSIEPWQIVTSGSSAFTRWGLLTGPMLHEIGLEAAEDVISMMIHKANNLSSNGSPQE